MNLASELLLGSSRVDQWRKEITTVVNMVRGFLTEDECYATLNLKGETLLAEADNHRWMVLYDHAEGLRLRLFHLRDGKTEGLACELPGNRISLEYVGFVHSCLDSFVKGMRELFPALKERWREILGVARYEFRMYYELRFHVPSDDPLDGEQGKLLRFRKKSDLSFPLPLNTEVFVMLEGEPSKHEVLVMDGKEMFGGKKLPVDSHGDCFFKVVEYEHQVSDNWGDLSERQFSMILDPQEDWENVPVKEHFPHLLEVNGWEQLD